MVELRRMLLLPLDDLLLVTPEFINAAVSHLGLDRCMRRHVVSQLRALQVLPEGEQPRAKTFKDCEPGFIHVDMKYLPQMLDEGQRRYLFVAIDRATRWVFVHIYADQSEVSSCDFLSRLYQAAPMKISKILTDNGSQLTDRFTGKTKQPSGKHAFDKRCAGLEIEHRLAPPRHPQTNVGWSSDSTLASLMSSGKRGSNPEPNFKQRSPATSRPTTTASRNALSIINPPFRRCKSGVKTSQICSKSE